MSRKQMKYLGGGKWTEVISNDSKSSQSSKPKQTQKKPSNTKPPSPPKPTKSKKQEKLQTKATKEVTKEDTVLEGTVDIREARPRLKAKKTVALVGLGSVLSGQYFVESVINEFSSSGGYTQKIEVSKNGFGENMKKGHSNMKMQIPPMPVREEKRPKIK